MRLSELLGSPVVDSSGRGLGVVQDLRATHATRSDAGDGIGEFEIVGIVIGQTGLADRAAHGWGYAEGRAQGPWVLRKLVKGADARSLFARIDQVASWQPDAVRLSVPQAELPTLKGALEDE